MWSDDGKQAAVKAKTEAFTGLSPHKIIPSLKIYILAPWQFLAPERSGLGQHHR
jgi:hypothetical protein